MDILNLKKGMLKELGKYKYVLVVLALGLILMVLPTKERDHKDIVSSKHEEEKETDYTKELEEILESIEGAGKVKVLLSISRGEYTVYQTDNTNSEDSDRSDIRTQTVLITDGDRNEAGLVYQRNPPTYMGAIILAQGADDPKIKLDLVQAVSNVTGLGADKISVLKMK